MTAVLTDRPAPPTPLRIAVARVGLELRLFARETRRAELAHWWAMCCGLLFVLWNPPLAAALLIGYGVVANLPFIVIQRYNRFRIHALLERRS